LGSRRGRLAVSRTAPTRQAALAARNGQPEADLRRASAWTTGAPKPYRPVTPPIGSALTLRRSSSITTTLPRWSESATPGSCSSRSFACCSGRRPEDDDGGLGKNAGREKLQGINIPARKSWGRKGKRHRSHPLLVPRHLSAPLLMKSVL
jgi:hypothetical protein